MKYSTVKLPCCPEATKHNRPRIRINPYTFQVVTRSCPLCGKLWELCLPKGSNVSTHTVPACLGTAGATRLPVQALYSEGRRLP